MLYMRSRHIVSVSHQQEKHWGEIEQLRNGHQKEVDKDIRMEEKANRQSKRYRKVELTHCPVQPEGSPSALQSVIWNRAYPPFHPNYNNHSLQIWTQVDN